MSRRETTTTTVRDLGPVVEQALTATMVDVIPSATPLSNEIIAAWREWTDAEHELDGKFGAYERAKERRNIALAKLTKLSTGAK